MEYCHLLDLANECENPYMRLVYASSWAISMYFAYQRTWKPFNPSHHPPMSAGHAENEHFAYDVTSKLKTKFLGNSMDVYPVGSSGASAEDGPWLWQSGIAFSL
ncbi:hypothetical protein Taro_005697 [Colocasia esculenta]|uniref:Uncharacterized protein n=1 Tax=Colocasia esculenta TaxID=4460 RepID=A0A843TVE3_COLES|nr:hypothetical protein [Colocasia esculenta]